MKTSETNKLKTTQKQRTTQLNRQEDSYTECITSWTV